MTAPGSNDPGSDNADSPGTNRRIDATNEPVPAAAQERIENALEDHGGALWLWQLQQLLDWPDAYTRDVVSRLDERHEILQFGLGSEQRLFLPEAIPDPVAEVLTPDRREGLGVELDDSNLSATFRRGFE